MKKILFVLLLTLAGCNASANIPPVVNVMHDDAHAVTCWLSTYNGSSSITCLPNSWIEDPGDGEDVPDGADADQASAETSVLNGEIFGL